MSNDSQTPIANLNSTALLNSLGQGVLIFDPSGELLMDNTASRQILGANLVVIRQQGWPAFAMMVDSARIEDGQKADEIRTKALRQTEPIRFHMLISDAYAPCWVSAIHQENSRVLTVISIERPDWSPLTELMNAFRNEALPAIDSTLGHAKLIRQIATNRKEGMTADQLAERILGFTDIMTDRMTGLQALMHHLQRLESIRTGELADNIAKTTKTIGLADFVEDFVEELDLHLKHESVDDDDYRDRLQIDISDSLQVKAASQYLTYVLIDVLKNAFLYSKAGTPIQIRAFATNQGRSVQIDIVDQGCGIREKEFDRVFTLFQRARQPQVIAEFGYGVSLALTKANIEAMGGRIWFVSEEKVGTTFSLKLPTPLADKDSVTDTTETTPVAAEGKAESAKEKKNEKKPSK
jgi:signal transduction histidine kinase